MFSTLYLFLSLICLCPICVPSSETNSAVKNDIELGTCIENFNIHRDKIIRTQDSREMGAKYLNEIDLGSREECLRLCCETETCDVFVYEEKTPGSCYLFACGPPEDFKCKFTRHANYSSGVLAVTRRLSDIEDQIKLTKHELDLTRLRKPENENMRPLMAKIAPTQIMVTTTQKSKEIVPIAPTKPPIVNRRCNPFQFECRVSGECIGIYNACDGVPQCADGSDEATELGCPVLTTIAPARAIQPVLPPPQIHENYLHASQLRKPLPPLIPGTGDPGLRPVLDSGRGEADPRGYQEAPRAPFMPPARPQQQQNNQWLPQGLLQQQVYSDKNSRIFQHKQSGIQVLESGGNMQGLTSSDGEGGGQVASSGTGRDSGSGLQYGEVNLRNEYQKTPQYYGDMYNRQQYPAGENWQPNTQPRGDNNAYLPENWQQQIPQQQNTKEQNVEYHPPAEVPAWKSDLLNKPSSKTFSHTVIHEPKPQTTNTEYTEIHKHEHKAEHLKQHSIIDSELRDGEAERPGGAILSLTLGITLTCVMAILIGCRLRVVRRRMRRGGKSPYAHDADYLVNGMYL